MSQQIHHIRCYEGALPGFEHPQYRIDIDSEYLGEYLNRVCATKEFDLLVPPLALFSRADQQKVRDLVGYRNVWLPVLVCSDDMDLSCIVAAAYVEESGEQIVWRWFAYGTDAQNPIPAPPLAFAAEEYREFEKAFLYGCVSSLDQ